MINSFMTSSPIGLYPLQFRLDEERPLVEVFNLHVNVDLCLFTLREMEL